MTVLGIITGVLICILGFYALATPFITFLGIGWLLGFLLLANGIEAIILGFRQEKKDVWKIILGALLVILGLVLAFNGLQRFLTDVFVAYMIGASIIISGINQIIAACKLLKLSKGTAILSLICGVLSIIIGLMALGHPFLTMISVGYIIGFCIVFQGINLVLMSLSKKKES